MVGGMPHEFIKNEMATCDREISEATGLTRGQLRRTIKKMEELGMIERQSNNRFSLIKLKNFNLPEEC